MILKYIYHDVHLPPKIIHCGDQNATCNFHQILLFQHDLGLTPRTINCEN